MSEITKGKKIVSGMVWRFGEKIAAQSVSLIVSIVLARMLMPEDYGMVAIVNVFITWLKDRDKYTKEEVYKYIEELIKD